MNEPKMYEWMNKNKDLMSAKCSIHFLMFNSCWSALFAHAMINFLYKNHIINKDIQFVYNWQPSMHKYVLVGWFVCEFFLLICDAMMRSNGNKSSNVDSNGLKWTHRISEFKLKCQLNRGVFLCDASILQNCLFSRLIEFIMIIIAIKL